MKRVITQFWGTYMEEQAYLSKSWLRDQAHSHGVHKNESNLIRQLSIIFQIIENDIEERARGIDQMASFNRQLSLILF